MNRLAAEFHDDMVVDKIIAGLRAFTLNPAGATAALERLIDSSLLPIICSHRAVPRLGVHMPGEFRLFMESPAGRVYTRLRRDIATALARVLDRARPARRSAARSDTDVGQLAKPLVAMMDLVITEGRYIEEFYRMNRIAILSFVDIKLNYLLAAINGVVEAEAAIPVDYLKDARALVRRLSEEYKYRALKGLLDMSEEDVQRRFWEVHTATVVAHYFRLSPSETEDEEDEAEEEEEESEEEEASESDEDEEGVVGSSMFMKGGAPDVVGDPLPEGPSPAEVIDLVKRHLWKPYLEAYDNQEAARAAMESLIEHISGHRKPGPDRVIGALLRDADFAYNYMNYLYYSDTVKYRQLHDLYDNKRDEVAKMLNELDMALLEHYISSDLEADGEELAKGLRRHAEAVDALFGEARRQLLALYRAYSRRVIYLRDA